MCRLLTYQGPEITLERLLVGPEHSLVVQSYRPKYMLSGTVNADGFGVGWYQAGDDGTAGVYRSLHPIWSDGNLVSMGRKIRSSHVLAHIRGATEGQPTSYENTQPFVSGRYTFIHNGSLQRFRETLMRPLREALPDALYRQVRGSTDSEHLFATWLSLLGDETGPDAMVIALEAAIARVNTLAAEAGVKAYLTLAVSDGETIVAARHGTEERCASLYALEDSARFPDAVLLASEPLTDDAGWRALPSHSLVCVGPDRRVRLV